MKLLDYLKENVKKAPDGLFLISGEKSYTYHQFNEEVNGWHHLKRSIWWNSYLNYLKLLW